MAPAFRNFKDRDTLDKAVLDLLITAFEAPAGGPFGVMLSGGSTPLPVYAALARRQLRPASGLHLMFTDDRHVPATSPDSNYGNTRALITALGLTPAKVLRVDGELSLEAAAAAYARSIDRFLGQGGVIRLALLGMGSDGHTCSLFSLEAAARRDVSAFAVPGAGGFDRVTVSAAVLERAERVVFFVAGATKAEVLRRFRQEPLETPAGVATRHCAEVEVWTDVEL